MSIKLLTEILNELAPSASWSAEGDTYNTVVWLSDSIAMPDTELVEQEIKKRQEILDLTAYQRLRKPEYPPLEDLADAIYWQRHDDNSKIEKYLLAVQSVKHKYPKD